MTKAEMEHHQRQYSVLLDDARAFVSRGQPAQALKLAVESLPHVDGMMQFARKYEDRELESIDTIALIFELAPALLHIESLDAVQATLKQKRRVERETADNLSEKLEIANSRLWKCHTAWGLLDRDAQRNPDSGSTDSPTRPPDDYSALSLWEKWGIVRQATDAGVTKYERVLRVDAVARAKCSNCGILARAAKSRFWKRLECPKCKQSAWFVLIPDEPETPSTNP